MSDRPMRLKYLTKMKIILCIFLLCITAVSVFGQSVELNCIVGESVKFTAAVKINGNLMHSGTPIGEVISGRFTAPRDGEFIGRVQWDSSTGLLSISGLRLKDSGIYTVQDTQQNINTVFQLNVYKGNVPVSKPHLSVTRNEYRCTVLCAAARGTGATLTLYKNGEKKPYVTSLVASAPHLHLPETVDEGGIYTCEAKNSVSSEISDPLTVGAHCTAPSSPSAGTIVASIIAVVAVLIAVVLAVLYRRIRSEHAGIRSEHAGIRSEHAAFRRIILALRRIIRVKEHLDNMVPPAYGVVKTKLSLCAVRRIILVKNLLDNLVPPAYVKNLLDSLVPPAYDDEPALIHNAVRRIILVKKLLYSLVPPANDQQALPEDVVGTIIMVNILLDDMVPLVHVKELPDNIVTPAYASRDIFLDEIEMELIHDAVRRIILDDAVTSLIKGKEMVAFPSAAEEKLIIYDVIKIILGEQESIQDDVIKIILGEQESIQDGKMN